MTSRRRALPPVATVAEVDLEVAQELLRDLEVAAWLDVSRRTLREWRYLGTGPAYIVVQGRIRYRRGDVTAYLDARRRPCDTP